MSWLRRILNWGAPLRAKVIRPERPPPVSPELWERAHALVEPHARACWKPEVAPADGPLMASKFGGTPWLAADEPWPICGVCRSPLQHVVQLESGTLPVEASGAFEGLLQLFYCTAERCSPGADDWNGFGRNQLVRLIASPRSSEPRSFPGARAFPGKLIRGWTINADCPSPGDLPIELPEELYAAFYEHGEEIDHSPHPVQGDKLLGWPDWVQDVEYVNCPDCGKPMRFVFQVASEDNVPYMFGDSGVGHISYCPEHPHRVAFRWACC